MITYRFAKLVQHDASNWLCPMATNSNQFRTREWQSWQNRGERLMAPVCKHPIEVPAI